MKKVIELIRVSTEGQADTNRASIPAQRAANRRTCAQYGLEIVRSIELSDVSGASVLLAPEIQELLQLIQSPEIQGVVAREFSRLMRPENFSDYALLQSFADTKTVLYLPEGPIDLNNKTGRLMGTIRAAIAGMERSEILERIWSAKEEKRRRGELAQSEVVLPWGVGYESGRGFYYKPEAERVREAFRRFQAGHQSYSQLADFVGVTPRGMHLILRNPIWTGWRVIDKRRDTSMAGRYTSIKGRQADRRKVPRAPEEIIRVQVIREPLISEDEFQAVQRVMDLKKERHWRCQPDIQHRFTYNGFLSCSDCGSTIHTALARRDYYTCKGRRVTHSCKSRYMSRAKLEKILDHLFVDRLTSACFVKECVSTIESQQARGDPAANAERLASELAGQLQKRARVIDSFVEGVISHEERDQRLSAIDKAIQSTRDMLARQGPPALPDVDQIIAAFAPLAEWEYWTRDQKRSVLSALVPDIRVADYRVESLGLNAAIFSNESTHTGKGSWRQPA